MRPACHYTDPPRNSKNIGRDVDSERANAQNQAMKPRSAIVWMLLSCSLALAGQGLTRGQAERLAQLPLRCLQREFPNKPGETLAAPADIGSPRGLHPAFYGCFDWHSSVHGHWLLVRLLKQFPDLGAAAAARAALAGNLAAENVLGEVRYLQRAEEKSFERTYGWAWLLKLAAELHGWDDPLARQLEANLRPLTGVVVERWLEFLPKLVYPVRVGEHANTAFAMAFAWDYAVALGDRELQTLLEKRARDFFQRDRGCPLGWEPSGFDFLSPCLEEADLMRRVLPAGEFAAWLRGFLPQLADRKFALAPGVVSDRGDGKLVHLDGLNFSRAWCLYGLSARPGYGHLRAVADEHLRHSLAAVTGGNYEGEHWLASFALLALSAAGSEAPAASQFPIVRK